MKPMKWIVPAVVAVLAAAAVLAASPALAGDESRAGTSGAGILRVPVGPRGTALSGAVVADASGVEAMYWNPAGITANEGTEALFSTMSYLVNSRIHFAGVTHNFGDIGAIGISVKALSFGDIAVTTEAAGGPTGEFFSPTFSVVALTLARQFSERANFGLSFQLVNESIRSEHATGVAFDLGFQYTSPWRGIRFGAVMKNFGPKMSYQGADFGSSINPPDADPSSSNRTLVTESAAFDMPSSFQIGVVFEPLESESDNQVWLTTAFQSNTFAEDQYRFGAEYAFRNRLFLRGGLVGRAGNDDVWGATFGGGVRVDLGGSDVVVDYALQGTSDFFDDLHLVSVRFSF